MSGEILPAIVLAQSGGEETNVATEILAEITAIKIIQAIAVLALTYWVILATDKFLHWISEKVPLRFRLGVKQSLPFWRAFFLGLAIAILIHLFLNLSPNNVLAITGTVAVALGFAFKDYASSVIAGLMALFERPYQVGDRVTIGDQYGEIIGYGLRAIQLQTPNDDIVTIPHNKMWTEAIVNANKGNVEAQAVVNFYFSHDADLDRIVPLLYRVAQTSKYTQLDLPISVILDEKAWGTHVKLKCYPMDVRDEFIYKSDLIRRAKRAFARSGITYPTLPPRPDDWAE
ncbi:mechanosensitive ion channel family protein [Lyngbya sp. CCY1209]|uniref:mechanosensitive ion channel family protein n=1 Tax=Lyngbya sp. CCY1209 TaxID=2886103 RepID=UPI002D213386|nr:mechanosensitive ion channel family protein [Lyngbya sp. CCY1209]MEB3886834.1 mechanosensitive ion channel family protein [Lyngbya sp. CCY1209]